ncbi:MAG TPA: 1,4-dihydroxy-2-naphthoate octaprenyltransferase [Burkholderiaceae bacterium]|nr:1,4-dihydroxy-2-naphthoate octaprenyltransferase [Burkholderiaceae bacterium]HQR69356.1 1,4-dihydroxy-2-naphthoate octaprenyltransferase [Burkholderiaceae bacterium]
MTSSSTAPAPAVVPGSLAAWSIACRLPSLLVAVSPVLVGTALAWERTGRFNALTMLLALAAAVLLQVISNLQNDVGYTTRGAERFGNRTGLPRATANGWLAVEQVRRAIVLCCGLTLLLGVPLVMEHGWPVLAMGLGSLAAALAYMGGPRPIAYTPLGELVVFVFFGIVAVAGSDYVQTGSVGATTWLAAVALGALAASALAVNNHRDIAHDRSVGRRTFAVVFGATASRAMYGLSVLGAFALLVPMALASSPALLAPLLLIPAALRLQRDFDVTAPGIAFNAILVRTFKLELGYAALLAIGAVLAHWLP